MIPRKLLNRKERRMKKLDAQYWREIWWSKKKAKEALVNLMVPQGPEGKLSRMTYVQLENGNQIPVEDVTEDQAHEFMKQLCPSWAFPSEGDQP